MRNTLVTLLLAGAICPTVLAASPVKSAHNRIVGDYVEARTASVFAGPCHFNGELTTTGREAEMIWHVTEGTWNGTALNGLTALASVVSTANLKDETAARRAVLFIDAQATEAQAAAFTAAVKANYGKSLGEVVAIKRMAIRFAKRGESYRVTVTGLTKLTVDAMPNHACCTMPNLVWYKPLVELKDRRVGFTRTSGITDRTLQTAWEKNDQNTAFYGTFAL